MTLEKDILTHISARLIMKPVFQLGKYSRFRWNYFISKIWWLSFSIIRVFNYLLRASKWLLFWISAINWSFPVVSLLCLEWSCCNNLKFLFWLYLICFYACLLCHGIQISCHLTYFSLHIYSTQISHFNLIFPLCSTWKLI